MINVVPCNVADIFEAEEAVKDLSQLDLTVVAKHLGIEYDGFKFVESKKYVDHTDESVTSNLPELEHWLSHVPVTATIEGKIVHGFKRGSKQLGVPTANIEMTAENIAIVKDLVPGVYAANGRFIEPSVPYLDADKTYQCALSIGWNP